MGRLIATYRATGSVAATAQEFGVTRQTVGQHLARAGVMTASKMNVDQILLVVQRYRDGASATAVGRNLGVGTHLILKVLRESGIEIRR